jgi:hypothetical protein
MIGIELIGSAQEAALPPRRASSGEALIDNMRRFPRFANKRDLKMDQSSTDPSPAIAVRFFYEFFVNYEVPLFQGSFAATRAVRSGRPKLRLSRIPAPEITESLKVRPALLQASLAERIRPWRT